MIAVRSTRARTRGLLERAVGAALLAALVMALVVLAVLIADVARLGWGVLVERGMGFVSAPLSSLPQSAGISQGIAGTLLMAGIVVVVAFPLGIAAGVYLEEYAPDTRLTRIIQVNVRNLAGVPAIVYGLLGLAVFVTSLGAITGGTSMLSGGLTLAILVLPVVIITTSEALRAVPVSVREAALGVGATRWQMIRQLVLPGAAPGILTGLVLALARALGETAPLLLVGAVTGYMATGEQGLVGTLRGPFTSLPTIVFSWARQPNVGFRELTGAAILILLLVILVCNAAALWLRDRYERRW